MHNRCRMIVASFLTKDLIINWQWGEKYFMQTLVDGDLAANNGGWQWSASSGMDPKPLRIFNPASQAQKFDPDGDYIRQWVPELKSLDTSVIVTGKIPDRACDRVGYPTPSSITKSSRHYLKTNTKRKKTHRPSGYSGGQGTNRAVQIFVLATSMLTITHGLGLLSSLADEPQPLS